MNIFKSMLLALTLALQIPLIASNKSTPQQRAAIILQHLQPEKGTFTLQSHKNLLQSTVQQQRATRMLEAMLPEESSWHCANLTMQPCNAQTPQGPSATESFINSFPPQELDALCTKIRCKTASENKPFIDQLIAQEKQYSTTHYTLYHGMNKDVLIAVLLNTELARAFEGIESPTWFKLRATQDFYNEQESLEDFLKHKNINDNSSPYQKWLLSTNLSFPGHLHYAGESTFRYFYANHSNSHSTGLIKKLFTDFITHYVPNCLAHHDLKKIILEYATKFSTMAKQHSQSGALLQLFINKNNANECIYLSQPGGQPHDEKFIRNHDAHAWIIEQRRYKNSANFLDIYQNNCSRFTPQERIHLQARILLKKDLFEKPHHAISMHLWHEMPPQEFTQLQQEIRSLITDFIRNFQKFIPALHEFKYNPTKTSLKTLGKIAVQAKHPLFSHYFTQACIDSCQKFTPETLLYVTQLAQKNFYPLQNTHDNFIQHDLQKKIVTENNTYKIFFNPCNASITTSYCSNSTMHLWNIKNNTKKEVHFPHLIYSHALSPCNNYIATACADKNIYFWDFASQEINHTITFHENVTALAFSPCGAYLALGAEDKKIYILELKTNKITHCFTQEYWIKSLQFSRCGTYLASTSNYGHNGKSIIWNLTTNANEFTYNSQKILSATTFSPCGKYFAIASWDNTACMWNLTTKTRLHTFKHDNTVTHALFSTCGKYLITSSWDKTVCVWDCNNGKKCATINHEDQVPCIAINASNELATACKDTVYLWNLNIKPPKNFTHHIKKMYALHGLPYLAENSFSKDALQQLGNIYHTPCIENTTADKNSQISSKL